MMPRSFVQKFMFAGLAVSTLAIAASAHAQIAQQTGVADPARAGEEFRQPELAPQEAPDVRVNRAQPVQAPAGAEKVTLTLGGITFDGATVYSDAALQSVFADSLGRTITLADLYAIANKLTLKYRNDGYILTQVVIPPQEIGNGVPRLQVVEGYVDKITVSRADPSSPVDMDNIQSYARRINFDNGPLNVRKLERELLLINDLPGVTARSVLSPSASKTGAADLTIILDYDPVDAIISANNFGSRYLGPLQLGGAVTLNSMLGLNEAISSQIAVAPQDWYELAYGSVGYSQPVGPYGTKIHFNANITDTDPGFNLAPFDVEGRSYLLNVGASHPFIRSRTTNLTGRLNFDWRRVKNENNVEPTRRDNLSVLRLGARYDFIDTLIGPASNVFDLELSKGLGIFGASDEGDANMSRAEGDPQGTKLEAEIQRLQRITKSVNLLLSARGQLASNALLSSEEFSVGGIDSGRGYDPSEIVGDHGISGRVELQWKEPVTFDQKFVESYQLYGFYDIGRVWNEDPTTASQKRDSLAAAGAGLRFDLPYDVDAGVAVAFPLTREVSTKDDRDPKYYFNLSKRF